MTKEEALRMALEALETNNQAWKHLADSGDAGFWEAEEQPFYEISVKAITAIKEALAQPEQDLTNLERHERNVQRLFGIPQPKQPPPECKTEAEKTAFAFGWFKALEAKHKEPEQERNFCQRCGKRLGKNDWDVHTCTPPQPEQEPFCYVNVNVQGDVTRTVKRKDAWCKTPLYTTPPQRTWVGLTDEELPPLAGDNGKYMELQQVRRFYKRIEAKLKEKNT